MLPTKYSDRYSSGQYSDFRLTMGTNKYVFQFVFSCRVNALFTNLLLYNTFVYLSRTFPKKKRWCQFLPTPQKSFEKVFNLSYSFVNYFFILSYFNFLTITFQNAVYHFLILPENIIAIF